MMRSRQKPIQRGGTLIDTGKIGYVKPIRQEIMLPGETIKSRITGQVNMETLRERDIVRMHAHIAAFMTPVRWLDDAWVDYVKGGPEVQVENALSLSNVIPAHYGIGGNNARFVPTFFVRAPVRIYNEWYKWPEDVDATIVGEDGLPAVNIAHTWTRCRNTVTPNFTEDFTVPSGNFTVQELAEVQARFRSAMDRDVLSYNRYIELLKDMYGADGSREVDQVPIMLEQSQLGVRPRVMPATDSAGLGDYASVYDFGLDFRCKATAPEHCILTYMLTIRFSPITEEINPHSSANMDWAHRVGDPEILASTPPVPVLVNDVLDVVSATQLGYLGAGYQWRAGWNQVGKRLDIRDSFPVLQTPTNATEARDATRRVNAFRSSSLGDFQMDFFVDQQSYSPISSAMSSFKAGMESGPKSDKFPRTGKVK